VGHPLCYGADSAEEFTVRSAVLDGPTLLRQATTNPAKMLKQEGRLGVVAPGALADLLILDRNPLQDITVLDRPELYLKAVYKEGRLYKDELHL
jgi:imidazolonepropionase-like amidohydrolase